LFGLITVPGLRHSEVLNLCRDDVDLDQGVLTIRQSKFGKSRLVTLHARTVAVPRDLSGAPGRTSGSAAKLLFLRYRTGQPPAASIGPPRLLAVVASHRASAEGTQRTPRS
jgi:integrase